MEINDILHVIRSEIRFTKRGNNVIGYDRGEQIGLSSGGRSILSGRTRYKGVDPLGYITESVYRNPIETIDVHIQEPPDLKGQRLCFERDEPIELGEFLESEPFGVLLEDRAERTRAVFDRISQFYADEGMIPPYEFDKVAEFKDMKYKGESAYSVSSVMPSEWSDIRLSELYLCLGMMNPDEERAIRMNKEVMKSVGFNLKQIYRAGVMPFGESEIPSEIFAGFTHYSYLQNYILFPLDSDHYGITIVDVSSSNDFEPGKYTEYFARISALPHAKSVMLSLLHPYKTIRTFMEVNKNPPFSETVAFESSVIQAFEYLRSEIERAGFRLSGFDRNAEFYDSVRKCFWEGFSSPKNRFLKKHAIDDVLMGMSLEEFRNRFEKLKSDVKRNRKRYVPNMQADTFQFPLRISN